ncbi:acetyl-CoA carboxylase biotin carboxyl carrier protein [Fusobacterium perfoetens]|uniref:acetyl-CoA carboxylase biotin carboxyl carrier protein n=1 Tax=Fusobacterium perfoetens TaxID=852 RepID=UPI00047F158D|nr:biotin/lipoyl-containing protein [Fusobacterium perfoetens]MCI6152812.1 hypothetical protein [Fusobacterium perfoetens]MDY3236706.1 biotin/lipoyl-containing protein [Fusobacterium perfoetens]
MEKDNILIDNLIDILNKNELSEIDFQDKDLKIKVKKDIIVEEIVEQEEIIEEFSKEDDDFIYIKSNNIGKFFFYDKTGVPLISVGQNIKIGQTIGFVSTVGIKTPIKSEVAGYVEQILLKNGEITDYGKNLIKLKKVLD